MTQNQTSHYIQDEVKKLLTIKVGAQGFAIAIDDIREIVYHRKISALPQSPEFVRGVTKIRHETIPVLDLNILLGSKNPTNIHSESCFITVLLEYDNGGNSLVCLLADRILQTYKIQTHDIDVIPTIDNKAIVEYVIGVFRVAENNFVLIDPALLISPYVDEMSHYLSKDKEAATESEKNHAPLNVIESITKNKNKYLSVISSHGENAFPLSMVHQVTSRKELKDYFDEDIPSFLYAATLINNKLVAIVKLNDFFPKENKDEEESHSEIENSHVAREVVVLVEYQLGLLGIVVDNIGKTYDVDNELSQNKFCEKIERKRIKSLGFIDNDDSSIEVVDPTALFMEKEYQSMKSWMKCAKQLLKMSSTSDDDNNKIEDKENSYAQYEGTYLIVQVGSFLIGLKSSEVDEVLSYDDLIPLVGGPEWCAGLLDLRQSTYPVINLHQKLDIEVANNSNEKRNVLVMISYKEQKIGLRLDKIYKSIYIEGNEFGSDEKSEIHVIPSALLATANYEKGIVHILNIKAIVETDNLSARRLLNELSQEQ